MTKEINELRITQLIGIGTSFTLADSTNMLQSLIIPNEKVRFLAIIFIVASVLLLLPIKLKGRPVYVVFLYNIGYFAF